MVEIFIFPLFFSSSSFSPLFLTLIRQNTIVFNLFYFSLYLRKKRKQKTKKNVFNPILIFASRQKLAEILPPIMYPQRLSSSTKNLAEFFNLKVSFRWGFFFFSFILAFQQIISSGFLFDYLIDVTTKEHLIKVYKEIHSESFSNCIGNQNCIIKDIYLQNKELSLQNNHLIPFFSLNLIK